MINNFSDQQIQALVQHYNLPLTPPAGYVKNYGNTTPEEYSSILQTTMMDPVKTKPSPRIMFPQNPQPYDIPLGNVGAAQGYAAGQGMNAQAFGGQSAFSQAVQSAVQTASQPNQGSGTQGQGTPEEEKQLNNPIQSGASGGMQ